MPFPMHFFKSRAYELSAPPLGDSQLSRNFFPMHFVARCRGLANRRLQDLSHARWLTCFSDFASLYSNQESSKKFGEFSAICDKGICTDVVYH